MFPRPPSLCKYTLNVEQWKDIMRNVLESKDCNAYEMYKNFVSAKPGKINPDFFYTREEFNAAYDAQYAILFPRENKRKR